MPFGVKFGGQDFTPKGEIRISLTMGTVPMVSEKCKMHSAKFSWAEEGSVPLQKNIF